MTLRPVAGFGTRSYRQRLVLAVLAGAVAALGQAPFHMALVACFGFGLLALSLIPPATPRRGFALALAGGTGHFLVALNWIVEPFFVDAARHGWMAPFAILAMAAGLALFWGLAGAAAVWLARGPVARMSAWAVALSLAELGRAYLFTGFPWAHPGHVWIDTGLLPLAALVGPHGLTVLTLFAASLTAAWLWRRSWLALLPGLGLAGALGLAMVLPPAPVPDAASPVLRIVQPNAQQHLKWQREMIPVFFERALQLSEAPADPALGPADAVIWPETSLQTLVVHSEPWRMQINAATGPVPVIVGSQRFEGETLRNSLLQLDDTGAIAAIYDKHHLVPFGEYLPMGWLLTPFGLRGLAESAYGGYGRGSGPGLLDLGPLGRAFPMICYETIFPQYIRRVDRPDWLIQITNDAWFGAFSGPYQHLALARLRAAEQGLPLVRAANTGVSAVIDARGAVLASLPLGAAGTLDAALPGALPATPYARTGDWPALITLLLGLGLLAARRAKLGH